LGSLGNTKQIKIILLLGKKDDPGKYGHIRGVELLMFSPKILSHCKYNLNHILTLQNAKRIISKTSYEKPSRKL
jgi:hypothetical protein